MLFHGNRNVFWLMLQFIYFGNMGLIIGQDMETGNMNERCIEPGSSNVCSGRGDCIFGMCACRPRMRNSAQRYSGKYCQCDDYACPYSWDYPCGGPERGQCKCGQCVCKPGWTGDACGCTTSEASCMGRDGNGQSVLCSGRGSCQCGLCRQCEQGWYGPTCQDCPTCQGVCDEYRSCIQCRVFRTGPYSSDDECYDNCADKVIHVYDSVPEDESSRINACQFLDDDNCIVRSSYRYNRYSQVIMRVQIFKECPSPA